MLDVRGRLLRKKNHAPAPSKANSVCIGGRTRRALVTHLFVTHDTCPTHPSPFDHVALHGLLRARRVLRAVHERLVPVRVVVLQHRLARVPPVLAVQVVRAAVAARAADGRVARRGRVAQAPQTAAAQVGHVPACEHGETAVITGRRARGWIAPGRSLRSGDSSGGGIDSRGIFFSRQTRPDRKRNLFLVFCLKTNGSVRFKEKTCSSGRRRGGQSSIKKTKTTSWKTVTLARAEEIRLDAALRR